MSTPVKFETAVSAAIVAGTLGILVTQTVMMYPSNFNKYANVGLFLQVLLCASRALTLVIQCIAPNIDCKALGNVGMLIYALWITALDTTLLLRSLAFLVVPKHKLYLKIVSAVQISISLGIQLYVAGVAFTLPFAAPYCIVLSDFSVQDYTLLNRCILYAIYLVPFVQRGYLAYKADTQSEKKWIRMCLNNAFFSVMIMTTELVAARVSQIVSLIPWLQAFFACVNLMECQFMLMIIDDTKRKLKSGSGAATHASSTKKTQGIERSNYELRTNPGKLSQSGDE
jgi:hypothetical protein